MKTAVYLRISDDKAGLELGIDRQRDACLQVCARRGWANPVEYADNDISAFTGKARPAYRELMAAIDRGEVKRVVVYHLSRLWRNRRERADGIERMKARRVTLECARGPSLDMATAYGRGMAEVVGSFDTMESEVKSERLQDWARQRAARGLHHGGGRLYGFTDDGLSHVPDEAAHVARWFGDLLAGRKLRAIARDAGVPPSTMRKRLTNPRYAGLRIDSTGAEHKAVWDPIVPVDVWRAACAILGDDTRVTNGGTSARRHLGSGLYRCERCGHGSLYTSTHERGGRRVPVYRCRPELGGCGRRWRQREVDAYVVAVARERLGRPYLADLLPVDRPDLEALRLEAAGIRARLRTIGSDYVRLGLDEDQVRQASIDGRARLAEIEAALATQVRGGVIGALYRFGDPVAAFDAIPATQVDRRQAVIRALMTVTLTAPPRGATPRSLTDDEIAIWYGRACVHIGPPSE